MVEDRAESKFDRVTKLYNKRQEVGRSSRKEVNYAMQEVFPALQSDLMDDFNKENRILKYFGRYKDKQENAGRSLSRSSLCATVLLWNVTDVCMAGAEKADSENNMAHFKILYDFAMGSELVLISIPMAEAELSGRGEDVRLKVVSYESKAFNIQISNTVERYLRMERDDAGSLRLLRQDPSGFSLLDSVVEKVKAGSDLGLGFCTKEYVLAGAETATDLYKKLYKIAAPLYPQGSSE